MENAPTDLMSELGFSESEISAIAKATSKWPVAEMKVFFDSEDNPIYTDLGERYTDFVSSKAGMKEYAQIQKVINEAANAEVKPTSFGETPSETEPVSPEGTVSVLEQEPIRAEYPNLDVGESTYAKSELPNPYYNTMPQDMMSSGIVLAPLGSLFYAALASALNSHLINDSSVISAISSIPIQSTIPGIVQIPDIRSELLSEPVVAQIPATITDVVPITITDVIPDVIPDITPSPTPEPEPTPEPDKISLPLEKKPSTEEVTNFGTLQKLTSFKTTFFYSNRKYEWFVVKSMSFPGAVATASSKRRIPGHVKKFSVRKLN